MYNSIITDILKIVICAFAVFGMYSFVRTAVFFLAKRPRLFIGVYLSASMSRERVENDIALALEIAEQCRYTHSKPILLLAGDSVPAGCDAYEIYQKKDYHGQ